MKVNGHFFSRMKVAQHFYKTQPIALIINEQLKDNPLLSSASSFQSNDIKYQSIFMRSEKYCPSVSRFNGDQKLQISDFLNKLCVQEKIGFYKNRLMTILEPARYTWVDDGPVSQFIQQLTQPMGLAETYRQALYNHASWILTEGSMGKHTSPIQTIFPRIQVCPHLWEFQDQGVYNFLLGTFEESLPNPFSSCSKFHTYRFDQLPYPQKIQEFLNIILFDSQSKLEPFFIQLGSLFHPVKDRKSQNAIWLHGESGTYKTWFVKQFLEHNFNELLVTTIESGPTQFQYGRLRGVTEGILFIDEYRSYDFPQPSKLLQVIDGQKVPISEKYLKAEVSQFKGQAL